jgi:hypothetical protein
MMAGVSPPPTNFYKNLEVSVGGGLNWLNTRDTHLIISPFETDSIQISTVANHGAWRVGLGYYLFEDQLAPHAFLNHLLFEVNVYRILATVNGDVWQFELPEFNNYIFKTPLSSTRLMFDFKPSLFTWNHVSPYPILGVGVTWNDASYTETAAQADIMPNSSLSLSKHTNTQTAWDVGAGLTINLTNRINASIEYIYAFLGHVYSASGPTNGVNLSEPPRFSLQTQSLLFGLSFTL